MHLGDNPMKISFLIANYNTSDLTIKLVRTILDYCDFSKGDKEIIIVDDASRPEERYKLKPDETLTPDLLKDVDKKILDKITIRQLEENKGIGNAMNVAIETAQGKYGIRLDNDTEIIEKDFDEKLIKILEDDKEAGLVTCVTDNIASPIQKITIPEVFKEDKRMLLNFVKDRDCEELRVCKEAVECFAGFCMAFRKEEVGNFFIGSKMFGEDNIKYLEYLEKGMKCIVAQKLFIVHHYHGTTKHINPEEVREASRIAKEEFMRLVRK